VNPNGVIEILFRGAHLHGDADALHHFSGAVRGDVAADHLVRGHVHDDLEEGVRLALGERVLQG